MYNCSIQNITEGEINSMIDNYVYNLVKDCQLHIAHFIRQLVSVIVKT